MRLPSLMALILLLIPGLLSAADDAAPIALHPRNPKYFQWHGQPTVLVTSGEHYGALLNTEFDFDTYFQELQSHGLNHTRLFSGAYREVPGSFNITNNTLAPTAGHYLAPWARSDQPGESDGGNKFDLTKWDEKYFQRLDALLKSASEHGIVVEFNLFCPMYEDAMWNACPMHSTNNVNGIGDCPRAEVYSLQHDDLTQVQLALTRKLVEVLQPYDNLYFEVCNEPYFGGVTMDWQHRIIEEIVATEGNRKHPHLISLNIANGREKVEQPHAHVSIYNFHYCVPPDVVQMNQHLPAVIGENETGFRGSADIIYRTEGWDFMLAGGGLYNNLDYSFTPGHEDGSFTTYTSPGGGSQALREQLGILKRTLESVNFIDMHPDKSLLKSVSNDLVGSLLTDGKGACLGYFHVPLPYKPENLDENLHEGIQARVEIELPAGTYSFDWLNCIRKGGNLHMEFEHSGGTVIMYSPAFANDIAIRITPQ